MTRLRQFLSAVAALVIGGMGLNEALQTTMNTDRIDCNEMRSMARELEDVQQKRSFYLALQTVPDPIPEAHGSRVLGSCAGGTCGLSGCGLSADYTYKVLGTLNSWKLVEVWAHPYFARGWQAYAADTADTHFFGSMAEAKTACLSQFTGAQCLSLLSQMSECWQQADDTLCRYGQAPDGTACSVTGTSVPIPCICYGNAACWEDAKTNTLDGLDP